ncbi:hypothetical protein AQUCO_00900414v1 [Aquilegia coerulea]|uniref:Uncharacterized protein n=1 Tax=Aquilegia coerulea TaxID=218851 RepID=A0A2G5EDH2_AQUCA|nr:hypothetical protein AQUCO_00900414v1 [Aquilegia coerulea]PIA53808.1 hypothetical protein AQUCO_00900414v1 [Aquilegia coerulea]
MRDYQDSSCIISVSHMFSGHPCRIFPYYCTTEPYVMDSTCLFAIGFQVQEIFVYDLPKQVNLCFFILSIHFFFFYFNN